MNITTFNRKSFSQRRPNDATIRVQKVKLSLSSQAVKLMNLKPNDKVLIHQDNDNPAIWYLSKDPSGFDLGTINKNKSLFLYSSELAQMILAAFEAKEAFNFYVDSTPIVNKNVKYWKLTTEN